MSAVPSIRHQRARGTGRIDTQVLDGRTRLTTLFQEGCAKIRLPHTHDRSLQAVLINTAGGLTGGDEVDWQVNAVPGARMVLTTQACERVYRSLGDNARVRTRIEVGAGAHLDWLPQETILFDGGGLSRRLEADLAEGARLLAVEAVVLGRTAMDEIVRQGTLRDRWRIRREGRLVFADDLRLEGPIADLADQAPMLAGGRAFASLLLVDDDAGRFLAPLRAVLGPRGGASAFEGKLFARLVAPDGFTLRQALLPALEVLRDGRPLPRVWRT